MNTNLRTAKRAKNDEFYTQYSDIEKELQNYDVSIFKDKVIYLPTDVASFDATIPQSEFVRYFLTNAERLGYKRLIATCLEEFIEYASVANKKIIKTNLAITGKNTYARITIRRKLSQ